MAELLHNLADPNEALSEGRSLILQAVQEKDQQFKQCATTIATVWIFVENLERRIPTVSGSCDNWREEIRRAVGSKELDTQLKIGTPLSRRLTNYERRIATAWGVSVQEILDETYRQAQTRTQTQSQAQAQVQAHVGVQALVGAQTHHQSTPSSIGRVSRNLAENLATLAELQLPLEEAMSLLANTIYTRLTQKDKTAGHRHVPFLIPQDVQQVIESSRGPTAETQPPPNVLHSLREIDSNLVSVRRRKKPVAVIQEEVATGQENSLVDGKHTSKDRDQEISSADGAEESFPDGASDVSVEIGRGIHIPHTYRSPSSSLRMSLDNPMDAQLEQEASPPSYDGHASFKLDRPSIFSDTDVDEYQHRRKRLKTKQDQEHGPSVNWDTLQPVRCPCSKQEGQHSFGDTHAQHLAPYSPRSASVASVASDGSWEDVALSETDDSLEHSVACDTGRKSQPETKNHTAEPAIQEKIATRGDGLHDKHTTLETQAASIEGDAGGVESNTPGVVKACPGNAELGSHDLTDARDKHRGPVLDPSVKLPSSDLRGALTTLAPGQWLSATAIELALAACPSRGSRILDSACLDMIGANGQVARNIPSLKNASRVLIPLHLERHWALTWLDLTGLQIYYYNSVTKPDSELNPNHAQVSDRISKFAQQLFGIENWTFKRVPGPEQSNSFDCGIHVIAIAFCVLAGSPIPSSLNGPLYRTILKSMLLGASQDLLVHDSATNASTLDPVKPNPPMAMPSESSSSIVNFAQNFRNDLLARLQFCRESAAENRKVIHDVEAISDVLGKMAADHSEALHLATATVAATELEVEKQLACERQYTTLRHQQLSVVPAMRQSRAQAEDEATRARLTVEKLESKRRGWDAGIAAAGAIRDQHEAALADTRTEVRQTMRVMTNLQSDLDGLNADIEKDEV